MNGQTPYPPLIIDSRLEFFSFFMSLETTVFTFKISVPLIEQSISL